MDRETQKQERNSVQKKNQTHHTCVCSNRDFREDEQVSCVHAHIGPQRLGQRSLAIASCPAPGELTCVVASSRFLALSCCASSVVSVVK